MVSFFSTAGGLLAMGGRDDLAADAAVGSGQSMGFRGVALAINVEGREQVDVALEQAVAAGGQLLRPGTATGWGGYSGCFADPDEHVWHGTRTRTTSRCRCQVPHGQDGPASRETRRRQGPPSGGKNITGKHSSPNSPGLAGDDPAQNGTATSCSAGVRRSPKRDEASYPTWVGGWSLQR